MNLSIEKSVQNRPSLRRGWGRPGGPKNELRAILSVKQVGPPPPGRRETTRSQEGHMIGIRLVERILDGDIGALICALIPFALLIW